MTLPVDVVLHIGSGKTGTTTVQQYLRRHPEQLAGLGVLYPRSPGRLRHTKLGLAVLPDAALAHSRDWLGGDFPPPDVFRRRFRRRLRREIEQSGASRVLFSDEGLFAVSEAAVGNLREMLDGFIRSVRVIVYLRRQDDHLVSRYQQVVKMGEVAPLSTWATKDFTRTYDYYSRLTIWQRALRPDQLVVRPFERDRFVGGSLLSDFSDAAGLRLALDPHVPPPERNVSLGAAGVEVLRLLNRHRIEHLGQNPWEIDNRAHVTRLAAVDTGPVLTLPDDELDRFMARWMDSNRAVARELLPPGSGELFQAPRKTGGTAQQRIEQRKLDELLDVLELPADQRAAIRALARADQVSR